MKIDPVGTDRIAAKQAERLSKPESDEQGQAAPLEAAPNRGDSVELSDEGRSLSSSTDIFQTDPARVAQIQARIADGSYHSPEVAERIAQRLAVEFV